MHSVPARRTSDGSQAPILARNLCLDSHFDRRKCVHYKGLWRAEICVSSGFFCGDGGGIRRIARARELLREVKGRPIREEARDDSDSEADREAIIMRAKDESQEPLLKQSSWAALDTLTLPLLSFIRCLRVNMVDSGEWVRGCGGRIRGRGGGHRPTPRSIRPVANVTNYGAFTSDINQSGGE
ncbi:hypothetical protein DFH06DRAFT_1149230 [Mycena polygramma]|nr:hypothetical protein DFH06DRAFT_1149230 [Mycena polygramma]